MSEDLEDLIESEAAKAASMASDAGKVERRSIPDLIAADNQLAAKRAAARSGGVFGLRIRNSVPGGTCE